jgi:hypothetical protein
LVFLRAVRVVLTISATAEHGQFPDGEAALLAEQRVKGSEVFVVQVGHLAASIAHQMVVRDLLFHLEETPGGAQVRLSHQSETDEQLEGAVDGGHVDVRKLLLHLGTDIFGTHMRAVLSQDVPHEGALGGQPVAELLERPCSVVGHRSCEFIAIAWDRQWVVAAAPHVC